MLLFSVPWDGNLLVWITIYTSSIVLNLKKRRKSKSASIFLKPTVMYEYDFGDGWEHHVLFEKILPAESSASPSRLIS